MIAPVRPHRFTAGATLAVLVAMLATILVGIATTPSQAQPAIPAAAAQTRLPQHLIDATTDMERALGLRGVSLLALTSVAYREGWIAAQFPHGGRP